MPKTVFVLFAELNRKLCITYFISVLSQSNSGTISHSFGFWFLANECMDLTLQDVLLGKLDAEVNLLNFFIIVVKLHIWMSRNHGITPNLSAVKNLVKAKFRTEKYIATKNNTECNFQARWQPYINSLLDT